METYKIKHPYLGEKLVGGFLELEIESEGLIYTELQTTHFGVQCNNLKNEALIRLKCRQVADLIREIDNLNSI
jgi:hypothetical protein